MRRLVGVALLALLLAQWTALLHTVAHAPWQAGAAGPEQAQDGWGHEAGTATCQFLDQLIIAQAPGADPARPPSLPAASTPFAAPDLAAACGPARWAYEARGPPRA